MRSVIRFMSATQAETRAAPASCGDGFVACAGAGFVSALLLSPTLLFLLIVIVPLIVSVVVRTCGPRQSRVRPCRDGTACATIASK
jgi:hypothetical protein